jgi:hypothetical protein
VSRIGVSVTKSVAFRNSTQEFSNVYYYTNGGGGLPDSTQADAIIDAVVAQEKTFHSTDVTFVRGRLWSQGGSPGSNNMISQKNLSGTGARSLVSNMDKERAFLFRIRAGTDSRGQPVYLRKWFHACGQFYSGQSITEAILKNSTGFTSTDRTSMRDQMLGIDGFTAGGSTWRICAKSGRDPSAGENWQAHQFLEHHQLGDQWRAQ